MTAETVLLEKYLKKFRIFLRCTGVHIDEDDINRNFKERVTRRWFLIINFIFFNFVVVFEIVWFFNGILIGRTINELTYVIPCVTVCLLGNFKMLSFLYYAHHVIDIIWTLRRLQSQTNPERKLGDVKDFDKRIKFLNTSINTLGILNSSAPFSFGLCSLLMPVFTYMNTNELKLLLPFYVLYPFNAFDLRIYPVIFLHQVWCGFNAVYGFLGPDCFFYTSATFIHLQLRSLQLDIKEITLNELQNVDNTWLPRLKCLVEKHRQLIRCINMLETIFSKSTLFNVVTSSFTLCLTCFNIIAGEDMITLFSFTAFFIMGFVQIFTFCYYGDMLSASTVECSNAVYNTKWYEADVAVRKDLLFILIRSQKPCKMTASGFLDIDLKAFARILSASWSYFTLLFTMYRDQSE